MRITFAGAAGTVTGSRYLLETESARILVDCGLFQGLKSLRERNWAPLPFAAASLDAVVLTHAHIDHSGYLPRLINAGFRGKVWCTQGTADLLQILLPDSGFLQEEEARRANRYEYTHHHPALPLYTRAEAERALELLSPVDFHAAFTPARGVQCSFSRAGHILGSACLRVEADDRSVVFSGDVGRPHDPVMRPPEALSACDYLVIESTYGDRRHPNEDISARLVALTNTTLERGGTLVIPAFAVGRAQHLLHLLGGLREERLIPHVPIYLDSPMAIDATHLLMRYPKDHCLSAEECERLGKVAHFTGTPDESRVLDQDATPKIIISASGMATGGRVLHHLRRFLPEARNTVLLVGYQASGTRGRSLQEGADELKIHGQYVSVRAQIAHIDGLSAHADYAELIDWLKQSGLAPRRVFVSHGEPGPADAFRRRLRDTFAWDVRVPELGDVAELP